MNVKKITNLSLVTALLISSLSPTIIYAFDEDFASGNDIQFSIPEEECTSVSAASITAINSSGEVPDGAVAYKNPVINDYSAAPAIIQGDDGTYHVYTTGFRHYTSTNMIDWKLVANASDTIISNTLSGHRWAPDIVKTGDIYTIVYTNDIDIGYGVSSTLSGIFKPTGSNVFQKKIPDYATIDPMLLDDGGGTYYMYFGSNKYKQGIKVIKYQLQSDNSLKKVSEPKTAMVGDYEYGTSNDDASIYTNEAPYVIKRGQYYYLFYSAGAPSKGRYEIRIARSKTPTGPFTKPSNKPTTILSAGNGFKATGQNSVITDAAGRDWIVYHAIKDGADTDDRRMMIDPITYTSAGWPKVRDGKPSSGLQQDGPVPGKSASNTGSAVSSCVCETPSNTISSTLVGKDNAEKIFNYFTDSVRGLSPVQAAGIIGNMSQESGFDPQNVQNNTADAAKYGERTQDPTPITTGWGLIQWTPGNKVLKAMEDAGLDDRPVYELSTQLDLVWAHMQNDPPITKGSFSIADFKKITDVEEAVNYFEDKIEGAGSPNYAARYAAAKLALNNYGSNTSTSANSLTEEVSGTCGDSSSSGLGAAAGDAVKTAINYAWPEYHSAPYTELKPSYSAAVTAASSKGKYVGGTNNSGVDCGGFITRAMQDSGVDPQYGDGGNTDAQLNYLRNSDKYVRITNPTSANLSPGAIAIRSGHTYMYVGEQSGFTTQIASASLDERSPMAGKEAIADPSYEWYVLK